MNQAELKKEIESKLVIYIKRFVRYAGFTHLTRERKEILAGTFAYLKATNDAVPDDVPAIGYLDDLMVFVEAARHFISTGAPVAGVCNPEEVENDIKFVNHNMGLMFGNSHFSINAITTLGKKHADNLPELAQEIKQKYANLGGLDND